MIEIFSKALPPILMLLVFPLIIWAYLVHSIIGPFLYERMTDTARVEAIQYITDFNTHIHSNKSSEENVSDFVTCLYHYIYDQKKYNVTFWALSLGTIDNGLTPLELKLVLRQGLKLEVCGPIPWDIMSDGLE